MFKDIVVFSKTTSMSEQNSEKDDLMTYEQSEDLKAKKLKESNSINVKTLQNATESIEKKLEIQKKRKEKKVLRRENKEKETTRVQNLEKNFENLKVELDKSKKKIAKLNKSIYKKNLAITSKNIEITQMKTKLKEMGVDWTFKLDEIDTASGSDD